MNIPQHKIKAAVIILLAVSIGIGIPLMIRLEPTELQALVPPIPLPSVSCSGVQSPTIPPLGATQTSITWKMTISNIPATWGVVYNWSGDIPTPAPGTAQFTTMYNLSKKSAQVIPSVSKYGSPSTPKITGAPCTVIFNEAPVPTLTCSGVQSPATPNATDTKTSVIWTAIKQNIDPAAIIYWTGDVPNSLLNVGSPFTVNNYDLIQKYSVTVTPNAMINGGQTIYGTPCTKILLKPSVPSSKIGLTCSATPVSPQVGDQVTWTAQGTGIGTLDPAQFVWSGPAATGVGKSVVTAYNQAKTYTAHLVYTDKVKNTTESADCSVTVTDKAGPIPGDPGLSCSSNPTSAYTGDSITWSAQTSNISSPDSTDFEWSGATSGQGQYINDAYSSAGMYSAIVTYNDGVSPVKQSYCSVNILDKTASTPTSDTGSEKIWVGGGTGSDSSGTGTGDGNGTGGTVTDPTSAPDILSCFLVNPDLVVSEGKITIMRCTLKTPALITARILNKDASPTQEPSAASIVKTLVYKKYTTDPIFTFQWDGMMFDNPVADGDYQVMVGAQLTSSSPTDVSIKPLKISYFPPPVSEQKAISDQAVADSGAAGLHGAAPTQEQKAPPITPKVSNCPGVNFPTDIENHQLKTFIQDAYNLCALSSDPDGTFKPDKPMLRAQAVRASLVIAGIPPTVGCKTLSCETPFTDIIKSWESQWIKAAWERKIVSGVTEKLMKPEQPLKRWQAVALLAKTFKIKPREGCYTGHCGAGYPNNFFTDIVDKTQGSYVRAFWDLHLVTGTGPNTFDPEKPITRAQFTALLMKTAATVQKMDAAARANAKSVQPAPSPTTKSVSKTVQTTLPTTVLKKK